MDATITRGNPETFADETYRGYQIAYLRPSAIWEVSHCRTIERPNGYRRGVGQTRAQARRWVDLLIEGKVK